MLSVKMDGVSNKATKIPSVCGYVCVVRRQYFHLPSFHYSLLYNFLFPPSLVLNSSKCQHLSLLRAPYFSGIKVAQFFSQTERNAII